MTTKHMADTFGGVKYSLWNNWHDKKYGRISFLRLSAHLKRHGCSFFPERCQFTFISDVTSERSTQPGRTALWKLSSSLNTKPKGGSEKK